MHAPRPRPGNDQNHNGEVIMKESENTVVKAVGGAGVHIRVERRHCFCERALHLSRKGLVKEEVEWE